MLHCQRCGGRRRLVALIVAPLVVHRILLHPGLPSEPPPIAPARPPPPERTLDGHSAAELARLAIREGLLAERRVRGS